MMFQKTDVYSAGTRSLKMMEYITFIAKKYGSEYAGVNMLPFYHDEMYIISLQIILYVII